MVVYIRTKFGNYSTCLADFREGDRIDTRPTYKAAKKPNGCRVKCFVDL